MSPASFATSVPVPIANPTSAFLSAAASLIPSPVIPVTMPEACASRTRRLLSVGNARATTRSRGSRAVTCASVIADNSLPVTASGASPSGVGVIRPASSATAFAVSMLSPVIITTWIPASVTSRIAAGTSFRKSSRIPISATNVSSRKSFSPFTSFRDTATASTRIALSVIARCFLPAASPSKE